MHVRLESRPWILWRSRLAILQLRYGFCCGAMTRLHRLLDAALARCFVRKRGRAMGPQTNLGYCERLGDGFWAEPLNAISNGAFLLAACVGLWLYHRSGRRDWPIGILIALVFAIAVGSFLFHTMPRHWTLLADVVPIQLFAFGYFGLALIRYLGVGVVAALLGTLAFLAGSLLISAALGALLPPGMAGSAGYVSFVLALFGIATALARREGGEASARLIALAGAVFAVSLTLRSVDHSLCQAIPIGTHWLWHILNAVVLLLLLNAAIRHPPSVR